MERKSSENIAAALKLLEEAAKQKKDELRTLMSDKYTNLRSLIMEGEGSLMESLTAVKDHTLVVNGVWTVGPKGAAWARTSTVP